jgi:hypothetical protein
MTPNITMTKGLLDWFYFESEKFHSYRSIEKTCKRMQTEESGKNDDRYAIYDIFYPLLRWGIVEYYGDDRFRLSPTAAIMHGDKALVCHPPALLHDSLSSFQVSPLLPGINLYKYCREVTDLCKAFRIPLTKYDFSRQLRRVPTIGKLVRLWDREEILDTHGYLNFNDYSCWVNTNGQTPLPGVYKKSDRSFAGKIVKLSENDWRTVPQRKQQLGGFSLAVLWSRIQNNHDLGICYSKQSHLLAIHTHFFPLVLERLLFINTILSENSQTDIAKRIYHIDYRAFLWLNKIFHNEIQIK